MGVPDDALRGILSASKTVAVVGLSRDPSKPSHIVALYLKRRGFRVVPVNPAADEIMGERSYARLSDIPFPVDVVDVFRPPAEAESAALEALALRPRLVWLQEGITGGGAASAAEAAGVPYAEDRCLMREHRRIFGR